MTAVIAGVLLLVFGLLPVADWLLGAGAVVGYGGTLAGWLRWSVVLLGVGGATAVVLRWRPQWWPAGRWAAIAARWKTAGWRGDVTIGAVVFALCAATSLAVFSGRPLVGDEVVQLYQARIFASGHLWWPAPANPAFTSVPLLLDYHGKMFGQFPPGGPAMLVAGVMLGAAWLVGPVFAGLAVVLFARLLRRIEPGDGTALAALLLFLMSPFAVFLGASMLNETATMAWIVAAALALSHATGDESPHPAAAFCCGAALGIAATIRPVDAAAFAIPAAVWLVARAARQWRRGGVWRGHGVALVASGIGVALPLGLMLLVNAAQTGHPLLFGYEAMWGKAHDLGFHAAPWGPPHTPARGLAVINLYLFTLQQSFLQTPVPSLLFATLALLATVRTAPFDRWMLAGGGLLLLGYFAYWFAAFHLGPRFLLPLAPWLALWTARWPARFRARWRLLTLERAMVIAGVAAIAVAALVEVPPLVTRYRAALPAMRVDLDRMAAAAGARHAVVLVRDSWAGELSARMWALGVPRADAQRMLGSVDACRLDSLVTATEARGDGLAGFRGRVGGAPDDSARLIALPQFADTAIRLLPGSTLRPACVRRIREDQAGFGSFLPALLAGGDNIYLRDLHAADSVMLRRYPDRPVWLLRGEGSTGHLRLERVATDSLWREWRSE